MYTIPERLRNPVTGRPPPEAKPLRTWGYPGLWRNSGYTGGVVESNERRGSGFLVIHIGMN